MTEEDIKEMNKVGRMMSVGAITERFDVAMEQLSRIVVDDRVIEPIHKAINPMLDDMIRQLWIMRNNVMAYMMGGDDTPIKVAQPIKFYRCRDCANENTIVCDRCEGLDDLGVKPSNWKPKDVPMDCDEGRICPKCGKVMVLCEDEKTYYEIWECDGCGHKENE